MRYGLFALLLLASFSCGLQRAQVSSSTVVDDHAAHMSAADLRIPEVVPATGRAQGTPGIPASANSAPARLAASPRHGEWVKVAVGQGTTDSIMAWIVYPSATTRAPVVVVVHEIYGLQTWVRGVADQVAADGFIAIAPDFLSRVRGGPSNVELQRDTASRLIRESRYAVIGYCWGGGTTFTHAVHGGVKGFSAGVAFYGISYITGGRPATDSTPAVQASVNADSMAKINVPLMLLNGSKDARIGAAMPMLDSTMKALKKDYSGTNYEGAIHGFLRAQDDPKATPDEAEENANLAAAKDAWPKTIAFLKKHLGAR